MYATDTGLFLQKNLDYLAYQKLDTLTIECSFGLHENRAFDNDTKIYVTHIAHKALMTHYDYEALLQSKFGDKVVLAYDGLDVNL